MTILNMGSGLQNEAVPTDALMRGAYQVGGGQALGKAFFGPSMCQNPEAVYNCFRNPILGIDPSDGGGAGILSGQMYWNVELGVWKDTWLPNASIYHSTPTSQTCSIIRT